MSYHDDPDDDYEDSDLEDPPFDIGDVESDEPPCFVEETR